MSTSSSEVPPQMSHGSNATYVRPRTRQRIPKVNPPLAVPNIEEDAAERKRVLNVLAQRRYRERKRQNRKPSRPEKDSVDEDDFEKDQSAPIEDSATSQDPPVPGTSTGTENGGVVLDSSFNGAAIDLDLGLDSDWQLEPLDTTMSSFLTTTNTEPISHMMMSNTSNWFVGSSSGSSPTSPSSFPSTIDPASLMDGSSTSSSDPMEFPDSYLLPVNELTLLRAFLRIGRRIGITTEIWDLNAKSPFNMGTGTPSELLPEALRPTPAQILNPHHPMLDLLPWPGVRDRVITMFSIPELGGPVEARDPMALVNFAYDMEDSAEGARIWGSDPYDPKSWEVGQVFFERWWFLFDRNIIEQSNAWRRLRGAACLHLKGRDTSTRVFDLSDASS